MSGRKRRPERGIFGIPKKKAILFTFKARNGEECSSDSEDSDYFPGRRSTDEEDYAAIIKKAKRKLSKKVIAERANVTSATLTETRRKKRHNGGKAQSPSGTPNDRGNVKLLLPPEVMLRIFIYGVTSEGIAKFLPRVSLVCKEWHQLASDPCLFEKLDLSLLQVKLTKRKLESFTRNDISQCKHLVLNGQTTLQSSVIEAVLAKTPRLINLDLFNCSNIKSDLVKQIPEKCPLLTRIDLSHPTEFNKNINFASIEALIKGCGARLVELRLARIIAVKQSAKQVLKLIEENCPNLEELDIRMNMGSTQTCVRCEADISTLIQACPKLKELRLDGVTFVDKTRTEEPYPGLPNLQIYSQSAQSHYPTDKAAFYKMFGSVKKLVELNVSSSNLLPSKITQRVKAVEHLYLSDMVWTYSEHPNLIECMDAWLMSIKTLDLSYNKLTSGVLDSALSLYRPDEDPAFEGYPLRILNLSNSNVLPPTVFQVVEVCKNLQEIDLTSCRDLPRGTKRIFKKHEFKGLLKSLQPFACGARDGGDDDGGDDDDDDDNTEEDDWSPSDSD